MIDAGCKERLWKSKENIWYNVVNGKGKPLANGVCIGDKYTKNVVPVKGVTKVYCEIGNQTVRSVDSKEGTVSIDFTIRMKWQDPRIKTKFSEQDMRQGVIVLSDEAVAEIWTPDLYILHRKSFDLKPHWAILKRATVLTTASYSLSDKRRKNRRAATMAITYDIKSTVYCQFHHYGYPMDHPMCNVVVGSSSEGAIFVLDKQEYNSKRLTIDSSLDFNISMTLFDHKTGFGNNKIGIKIKMDRKLSPFMLQYYIPCIAIAMVSQLSLVIPVTAIPGRVALLVTLFLTLVNLFIHQMVSIPF